MSSMTTPTTTMPGCSSEVIEPLIEHRGTAMGTKLHIVVTGGDALLVKQMRARLTALEACWSRFIDASEVSRLNAQPDRWHVVSPETMLLLQRAQQGWAMTDGAFDPTVLDAVEAHGYRENFGELPSLVWVDDARGSAGCAGIDLDRGTGLVRFGDGVRFDPGGIGKGLAADLVVDDAMAAGATGAMVNLGGDLACRGAGPDGDAWIVEITEPTVAPGQLAVIALENGAVATSTTRKRRWSTDDGDRHHLIDPSCGHNTAGVALATVVASEGWWAEVVAKQILVHGIDAPIDTDRAAAIVIDDTGSPHQIGPIERFLR